jgi:hypothetical protein
VFFVISGYLITRNILRGIDIDRRRADGPRLLHQRAAPADRTVASQALAAWSGDDKTGRRTIRRSDRSNP